MEKEVEEEVGGGGVKALYSNVGRREISTVQQ